MHVIDSGTVFRSQADDRRGSCAFPAICVDSEGRWLSACRAAPTKLATTGQHVLLTWSDDAGRTWREAVAPFDPPTREGRPGLFRGCYLTRVGERQLLAVLCWVDHSDPDLPFFNETTEGLLDTRICLAASDDGGETWSEPQWLDTSPLDMPTPITGPLLALRNGELACQFELNKPYNDPAVWHHRSVLMFSKDAGRTWPEHAVTTVDPTNRVFYWDQRPGVLDDGRILDVFWTFDTAKAIYLNIHAVISTDHGRTWSAPWDTGVPGQPAPPVDLGYGRLAMVFVARDGPPAIRIRTSLDEGHTWPCETECSIYESATGTQTRAKQSMQDSWAEMGAFSVGLPATARLPDGDVLVVYYAGPHADRTDVRWARLRG